MPSLGIATAKVMAIGSTRDVQPISWLPKVAAGAFGAWYMWHQYTFSLTVGNGMKLGSKDRISDSTGTDAP